MIREIKWMYFLIDNDNFSEKYNTIWDNVSADIKKEFDSKRVYEKEFLKTKIKSDRDEVTSLYDKKVPQVDSYHTCLAELA